MTIEPSGDTAGAVAIRIVLADDHPVVRSGFLRLLDQCADMRVVGEAGDADAAYEAYVAHRPDVLVTDLTMPGGGGLALIRHVRARDAQARIVVISMHDSALLVQRALDAGALGFMTKADAPERLVDAVRAAHAGRRFLGATLAECASAHGAVHETDPLAALSSREFDVFRLLAQGLAAKECAEVLHLSPKTISNLQTALKEKLGVATSAALVHLALRHRVIEPVQA